MRRQINNWHININVLILEMAFIGYKTNNLDLSNLWARATLNLSDLLQILGISYKGYLRANYDFDCWAYNTYD